MPTNNPVSKGIADEFRIAPNTLHIIYAAHGTQQDCEDSAAALRRRVSTIPRNARLRIIAENISVPDIPHTVQEVSQVMEASGITPDLIRFFKMDRNILKALYHAIEACDSAHLRLWKRAYEKKGLTSSQLGYNSVNWLSVFGPQQYREEMGQAFNELKNRVYP